MKKLSIFAIVSFAAFASNSYSFCDFGKEVGKDLTKDTIKIVVKECVTMPLINVAKKHINKFAFPAEAAEKEKAEKIKKETAEMMENAKQIVKFKAAGADKKFIASLSEKLTAKIQKASLESPCCKK